MAHATRFDTLGFVKELESAGFPSQQAEAQAMALAKALEQVDETRLEELATRRDLADTKIEIIKWVAGMFTAQSVIIIGAVFALLRAFLPT